VCANDREPWLPNKWANPSAARRGTQNHTRHQPWGYGIWRN